MVGGLILGVFIFILGVALIYFAPVIGKAIFYIYDEIQRELLETLGTKGKLRLIHFFGLWMGPLLYIWIVRLGGILALGTSALLLYAVLSGEIVINL